MFDLTLQEKISLWIGGSMSCLAYLITKYLNRHEKEDREKLKYITQSAKPNYIEVIEKSGKTSNIGVFLKFNLSHEKPIFLSRMREHPIRKDNLILQGVSSRPIKLFDNKIININDAIVFPGAIKCKREKVSLFQEMEPIVQNSYFYLNTSIPLLMFGAISFDIATMQIIFQPSFICKNREEIFDYFNEKLQAAQLNRILRMFFIALGVIIAIRPLWKLWQKTVMKLLRWTRAGKYCEYLEFVKNMEITTDKQHLFRCITCRKNPTEIIYKCGHLCECLKCHARNRKTNNGTSICPKCKKSSQYRCHIYYA